MKFETKYKNKFTDVHLLDYLILSKPQKLVYILIFVYIENYL